jgi:hypothetical protein
MNLNEKSQIEKLIDLVEIEIMVLQDKSTELLITKKRLESELQETRALLQRTNNDYAKAVDRKFELITKNNK